MNTLGFILFLGLIATGSALIIGLVGHSDGLPTGLISTLLAIGTVGGWFFGLLASFTFVVATLMHLIGRMPNYWQTFFPVNVGLTVLGVDFLWFRPESEIFVVWASGFVTGLVSAMALYLLHAPTWRILPIGLILLLVLSQFARPYLNQTLVQVAFAIIFIALPALSWFALRYRKQ
jgi:hypothetical protein